MLCCHNGADPGFVRLYLVPLLLVSTGIILGHCWRFAAVAICFRAYAWIRKHLTSPATRMRNRRHNELDEGYRVTVFAGTSELVCFLSATSGCITWPYDPGFLASTTNILPFGPCGREKLK